MPKIEPIPTEVVEPKSEQDKWVEVKLRELEQDKSILTMECDRLAAALYDRDATLEA